MKCTEKRNKN